MKRIIAMAVVAIMTTISAKAQQAGEIVYMFRAGANVSTLTGNDDAKTKLGWTIGTGIGFCFTDKFTLALDLSHDYIGAKVKSSDEDLDLEYISFGPMAKYYATPWFALQAGPEIGFLSKAKMDDVSVKSSFKGTEISVPIGVSVEPKIGNKGGALVIDLRYRLGLSNVSKLDKDMHNSAFTLTLGYRFPL